MVLCEREFSFFFFWFKLNVRHRSWGVGFFTPSLSSPPPLFFLRKGGDFCFVLGNGMWNMLASVDQEGKEIGWMGPVFFFSFFFHLSLEL